MLTSSKKFIHTFKNKKGIFIINNNNSMTSGTRFPAKRGPHVRSWLIYIYTGGRSAAATMTTNIAWAVRLYSLHSYVRFHVSTSLNFLYTKCPASALLPCKGEGT